MTGASEWDEAVFRRSLATLVQRPPVDAPALRQFTQYWFQSLDVAELSGAITGVEHDVLLADLQAVVRELPNVTVVEHSSSVYLRLPSTTSEE